MFTVTGEAIERFAQMTNWDYYEAANRFQKVLEAAGELKSSCSVACYPDVLVICPTMRMQRRCRRVPSLMTITHKLYIAATQCMLAVKCGDVCAIHPSCD